MRILRVPFKIFGLSSRFKVMAGAIGTFSNEDKSID